jgi:prophage regulatory protein
MRVLRKPDVEVKSGLPFPTIDRLERAGGFPKRVQIGPRAVGWVESEIDAWIADRIRERDAAA